MANKPKWFAINHNGYLCYLGEHEIDELSPDEYFQDEDMFQFMDEETARDYYDTLKPVFEGSKK